MSGWVNEKETRKRLNNGAQGLHLAPERLLFMVWNNAFRWKARLLNREYQNAIL
jgi:hypothetical protein